MSHPERGLSQNSHLQWLPVSIKHHSVLFASQCPSFPDTMPPHLLFLSFLQNLSSTSGSSGSRTVLSMQEVAFKYLLNEGIIATYLGSFYHMPGIVLSPFYVLSHLNLLISPFYRWEVEVQRHSATSRCVQDNHSQWKNGIQSEVVYLQTRALTLAHYA